MSAILEPDPGESEDFQENIVNPEELKEHEEYEDLAHLYGTLKSHNDRNRIEILEKLLEKEECNHSEIASDLESDSSTISSNEYRFLKADIINPDRELAPTGEALFSGFSSYLEQIGEEKEPLEEIDELVSCFGKRTSQGSKTSKIDAFLTFLREPELSMDEIGERIGVANPKNYFQEFEEYGLVEKFEINGPRVTKYRPTAKAGAALNCLDEQLRRLEDLSYI